MINKLCYKSILIVDDDPDIRGFISLSISKAGGEALQATDGQAGIIACYEHQPDLVLLDIMMPKMSGWQVFEEIRAFSEVPVIFLTALGTERDMVHGLDMGAVDYVTKPFSPSVLVARIRAALRKAAGGTDMDLSPSYRDDYLNINLDQGRVLVKDQPVHLTKMEFQLLCYFVENSRRLLTFQQILNVVWGSAERNIDYVHVYISRLRRKLEENPKSPQYFQTVHGLGYRFEPDLTETG